MILSNAKTRCALLLRIYIWRTVKNQQKQYYPQVAQVEFMLHSVRKANIPFQKLTEILNNLIVNGHFLFVSLGCTSIRQKQNNKNGNDWI